MTGPQRGGGHVRDMERFARYHRARPRTARWPWRDLALVVRGLAADESFIDLDNTLLSPPNGPGTSMPSVAMADRTIRPQPRLDIEDCSFLAAEMGEGEF